MPNHVQNKLIVSAQSEVELTNFLQSIRCKDDEERVIDFNTIIPMPQDLRDTECSSRVSNAIEYFLYKENRTDKIQKFNNCTININFMKSLDSKEENERNEIYNLGKKYVELYEKYGYHNWYDWSLAHWGTKWNAYDTYIEVEGNTYASICFTTAWSDVTELMEKLAKQNPNIDFEYKCASEDVGTCCVNAYTSVEVEGELCVDYLDNDSEEAIQMYCECWGYDFDDFYRDEKGYWHNREWEESDDD